MREHGDQVFAGLGEALLPEPRRIGRHLQNALAHIIVGHAQLRVVLADGRVRPFEELRPVARRHAEKFGQHLDRQRRRHRIDEFDFGAVLALFGQPVEKPCHAGADAVLHARDALGHEARRHHAPIGGVFRRIERDHAGVGLVLVDFVLVENPVPAHVLGG